MLPDDNRRALRHVVRSCRKAVLSTTAAAMGGHPYGSLVTVAFDGDLSPILLLSRLADHTVNLETDFRASLLLDGTDGLDNPQAGPRVTLMGTLAEDADPRLRARFLLRHPGAALYAGFADFAIWRMTLMQAHFVGGFARAVWFEPPLGLPEGAAAAVALAADEVIGRINRDHPDTVDAIARVLGAGAGTGTGWTIAAADPDGCELRRDEGWLWIPFDQMAIDAQSLGSSLAELGRKAASPPSVGN